MARWLAVLMLTVAVPAMAQGPAAERKAPAPVRLEAPAATSKPADREAKAAGKSTPRDGKTSPKSAPAPASEPDMCRDLC